MVHFSNLVCEKLKPNNANDNVLILYGDTPLITKETLEKMIEARENGAAVVGIKTFNIGKDFFF